MSAARAAGRVLCWTIRARLPLAVLVCLAGMLVAAGECLIFSATVERLGIVGEPTLGDALAFLLRGLAQPDTVSDRIPVAVMMRLPFGWIALVLLPSVLVIMTSALRPDELVASGNRGGHWLGRCGALLAFLALYWLSVLLVCAAYAAAMEGDLSFRASAWLPDVAGFSRETLTEPPYRVAPMIACAVSVSCAVSLGQLAALEVAGPYFSFLFAVVILAGSVFAMTPVLFGNYMMSARSAVFVVPHQVEVEGSLLQAGLDSAQGVVVALAVAALAVATGGVVVRRRDYLGSVKR